MSGSSVYVFHHMVIYIQCFVYFFCLCNLVLVLICVVVNICCVNYAFVVIICVICNAGSWNVVRQCVYIIIACSHTWFCFIPNMEYSMCTLQFCVSDASCIDPLWRHIEDRAHAWHYLTCVVARRRRRNHKGSGCTVDGVLSLC